MKKVTIILVAVVLLAGAVIYYSLSNTSTYASFSEAAQHPDREYHIVGKLNLDKEMIYNPTKDANLFTFYLKDNEGVERKVLYGNTKPQDFEKSEQVVIVGKMKDTHFEASQILMKCPSKYNEPGKTVSTN